MTAHSLICGSSSADRVIKCPASVKLVAQMPGKEENEFMARGTLLHSAIELILLDKPDVVGMTYGGQTLTQELYEEKIIPALAALDEIDPNTEMDYEVETTVDFGALLPGVFGTGDFFGRIGDRAVVLDWKFGDGVMVEAEQNDQLFFNAAGGMRTKKTQWVFEGCTEIEFVIVQPPGISRWMTTPDQVALWESEFVAAIKASERPAAPFKAGDHCRWCSAKPICPKYTQAVDRALATKIDGLPADHINNYLKNADLLEAWISDLRALAFQMLENGKPLADWKLVAKRGTRKWANEDKAKAALVGMGLKENEVTETSLLSPAQVEKVLKKQKLALPDDQVVSVSSGSTLARRDDPRPEVLDIARQMANVMKLQ